MCKKLFITISAALAFGCAAGGQANTPLDDVASSGAGLELIVRNQHAGINRMSVFARWRSGTRLYLGDVGAGQTETFTTPIRGQGFWLEHQEGPWRSSGRHADPTEYVLVQPGDRLEWSIWSENEVVYLRLPPR